MIVVVSSALPLAPAVFFAASMIGVLAYALGRKAPTPVYRIEWPEDER